MLQLPVFVLHQAPIQDHLHYQEDEQQDHDCQDHHHEAAGHDQLAQGRPEGSHATDQQRPSQHMVSCMLFRSNLFTLFNQ